MPERAHDLLKAISDGVNCFSRKVAKFCPVFSSIAASISYDFTGGSLPSGVTLSRVSTAATRFNASGVMVSEAANVARFDYDPVTLALRGLLVEPQVTNIMHYSVISTSGWTGSDTTILNNNSTAPDGSNSMGGIVELTTTNNHGIISSANSYTSGVTYTTSFFVKAGTATVIQFRFPSTRFSATAYGNFNVGSGVVGSMGSAITSSGIINVGGGIYLCWLSAPSTVTGSGQTAFQLTNNNASATKSPSYLGTAQSLSMWGVSSYSGIGTTSYIETTNIPVTRNADVVQFTIPTGVTTLRYTFDDNSTQDVAVSAGAYTVPTNLNRAWIKTIQSV